MKTRSSQRSFGAYRSLAFLGLTVIVAGCGQATSPTMQDSMKSDGMMQDGMQDGKMQDGMMQDGKKQDGMMQDGMMKDGMMKDGMKDGMAPAAEKSSDKKM